MSEEKNWPESGFGISARHSVCDELRAGWPWTSRIGLRGGVWGVSIEETRCLAGWYGELGRDWSAILGFGYFELSSWDALRKRGDWVVRGGREWVWDESYC